MLAGVFLDYSYFYGGTAGEVLANLERAGVFSYVLPFLVIFALITAILGRMKVFGENKGISVIIALAVSLMSLQFDFVPRFFSEIFPRLGVGLAIILAIVIILGLFMDFGNKGLMVTLLVVSIIVALVVLYNSADALGYNTVGRLITDNIGNIVLLLAILGAFIVIIMTVNHNNKKNPQDYRPLIAYDPK